MRTARTRNITRYTYAKTSFQGWRVSICRNLRQYIRYFSDRQFGGEQASYEAALRVRDLILLSLRENPEEEVESIFARYR